MAKDGTIRGGIRAGAGRKKKADTATKTKKAGTKKTAAKASPKKTTGRKTVKKPLEAVVLNDIEELQGEEQPAVKEYMVAIQKDGSEYQAKQIYDEIYKWLKHRKCEKLIAPHLIEGCAIAIARWIQCDAAISKYGFLAKHEKTGHAVESPYVRMEQKYWKIANAGLVQINQLVKEYSPAQWAAPDAGQPEPDSLEAKLSMIIGHEL